MKMPRFTNAGHAGIYFVYDFFDGNSLAVFREYQPQYLDQTQLCWLVFEMMHHNLRETGILMAHAHAGRGRHTACLILYTITNQQAPITFILQQDSFLRQQHGTLSVTISCIPFTYKQCKGCSQGIVSQCVLHKIMDTLQFLFLFYCLQETKHL